MGCTEHDLVTCNPHAKASVHVNSQPARPAVKYTHILDLPAVFLLFRIATNRVRSICLPGGFD